MHIYRRERVGDEVGDGILLLYSSASSVFRKVSESDLVVTQFV